MESAAWKRWLPPAVLAVALHAGLVAAFLAAPRFHGDPSALVCVGEERKQKHPFEHVRIGFESNGYDGQYCYALARDPWRPHSPEIVAPPAYRHLRVLYPAICWLLSGGHPVALLWVLPGVNLLAIGALAGMGAAFASSHGRSPWWGLLLPLFTHAGLPLLRDLTDAVGTLCAFGLLVAWQKKWRPGGLFIWAVLAMFAREQNLAIVGIVGLLAAWERDWRRALILLPACVIWLGWVGLLVDWYGDSPFVLGNFGLPFAGFARRAMQPFDRSGRIPTHGLAMAWLAVQLAFCLAIPWLRSDKSIKLLALAAAALMILGGWSIYEHWYGSLRVFVWSPLAIWFCTAQSHRSWPAWLVVFALPWPLLTLLAAWR